MNDYSNGPRRFDKKDKTESDRKRVEPVAKGKVKKKTELGKIKAALIAEDAENIKSYILWDVIIPTAKNLIEDTIHMILHGESGRSRGRSTASRVSYRSYYDDRRESNPRTRTGYNYDDVILETKGEAEEVLDRMNELIETYDSASVADLYDLVGISGNYTDNNYGWTNLRNAESIRVRDGYMLKLPKVLPLK